VQGGDPNAPPTLQGPSVSDLAAMTLGPGLTSATASQTPGEILNPASLPLAVRQLLARQQGNLEAIQARGDQSRQTNAVKPVVPRFIPGATPGSYVMPQSPGNGPPVPQRLPGVTSSGGGTGDAQAAIAERQRVNGWRQAYSRALTRYESPQADPVTGLKGPGMDPAEAQSRAAADASAAYGPPPQNTTPGKSPKGAPAGGGGQHMVTPEELSAQRAWQQANPKQPNETNEQWRARYQASKGIGNGQ